MKKNLRATIASLSILGLILSNLGALPLVASANTDHGNNNVPNPTLGASCGLDIALVLDSSASIDSTELLQMKNAFHGFVSAVLPATPTQFSVTDFDTTAHILQSFTGTQALVDAAINTPTSGGFTNWEDALLKAQSTLTNRADHPDLVIFASDGNPNRKGTSGQNATEAQALAAAVTVANSIKTGGARILAIGIGNNLNLNNLKAISGNNVNTGATSDVVTTDFGTLADTLAGIAKAQCGGTITIKKVIDNNGNGVTDEGDTTSGTEVSQWNFDVTPGHTGNLTDTTGMTGAVNVGIGTFSVTETTNSNYTVSGASCSADQVSKGTWDQSNGVTGISVGNGDVISCTFYNKPNPGTLTVIKTVDTKNVGIAVPGNFTIHVLNGTPDQFPGADENGTTVAVPGNGSYSVTEDPVDLYEGHFDNGCAGTMTPGGSATCNITNEYTGPTQGKITIIKDLKNYNGGTLSNEDFHFILDNNNPQAFPVNGQVDVMVDPGTHNVTEQEANANGYNTSYGGDCGNIQVFAGQSYTCTITNDDKAPSLTLNKVVEGGNAPASSWTLTATGPTGFSGAGPSVSNGDSFDVGSYTLSESGDVANYVQDGNWSCDGADVTNGNQITLALGQHATCTIKNKFVTPPPQNSCITPNGDEESGDLITFGSSGEKTLQQMLNDAPYTINVNTDQTFTQTWTGTSQTVDFTAKYIDRRAGADTVFGYFLNGGTTFVPLFKEGNRPDFPSIPTLTPGQTVNFTVTGLNSIIFAIDVNYQSTHNVFTTDNSSTNNTDGTNDHVASYNPTANEYVLGFEDLPLASSDKDYNDLTVSVKVLDCSNGPVCNPQQELLTNGSFETPVVNNPSDWNIFPSGTSGLGWIVDWFGGSTTFNSQTRPTIANAELQRNVSGWLPSAGSQYTELDSDWNGHVGSLNGEPGAVALSEDITTIPGTMYHLSFDFSPRPATVASQNKLEVLWGGTLGTTVGPTAGNATQTTWTNHTLDFTATTTSTRVTFRDAGTPNDSLGTFVDNASLKCVNTPPTTATVVATKIVCDTEADLPNWGDGNGPDITSSTASTFLNTHPNCHLSPDWSFQWAPNGTPNPGDNNTTPAGIPWTTFGPTAGDGTISVQIPPTANGILTWFREVLKTGFVLFTGANITQNVSAEMYCNTDHLKYDNYDWIDGAQVGNTYQCIAFNAPTSQTPPPAQCSDTIDNDEDGLIDQNDPGCHTNNDLQNTYNPNDNDETNPPICPEGKTLDAGTQQCVDSGGGPTGDSSTNNGGGSAGGNGIPGSITFGGGNGIPQGQVLGASCGLYMDKHIRLGSSKNDKDQVMKLQTFLNKWMGTHIPVTGFYGPRTLAAVNAFQTKYGDQILKPWGISGPTGLVYLSTLRHINALECPDLSLTLPPLVPWSQNPSAQ